jgi:hypothetical protein
MFITITLKVGTGKADIRIDNRQRIGVALSILRESGKLLSGGTPDFYRSKLGEKLVSAYKTFNEEGIFDGDILEGVNQDGKA